jgi:rhamnosyltransferase
MLLSIIIRTYNEERYLNRLLNSIVNQIINSHKLEIIIVDSGSTDATLSIANAYKCTIKHINKYNFTFGRSLNLGCQIANGKILIFISGHCIPVDEYWLLNLIDPIINNNISLTYGRQIGGEDSKFSEKQIFKKYFPTISNLPQNNFFCNNANSAILKSVWENNKFDEDLTGLEDMHIAKSIFNNKLLIGYVANSVVFHLHHENWLKIKNRFEREALALQKILPEVHVTFTDFVRYFISSVWFDFLQALKEKVFFQKAHEIIFYRSAQYWGTYKGNNPHRKISNKIKEQYFFPR